MPVATRRWFPGYRGADPDSTLLFCLPCAGASAAIYRSWRLAVRPGLQIVPVEPPGRGARFAEEALSSMPPLIEALVPALLDAARDRPFALFGHSMGAWIAWEASKALEGRARHLFVSAAAAPHIPQRKRRFDLNDSDLKRELNLLGGTPTEILDNDELMQLLLPMLRADFALVGSYRGTPEPRARCPITAFAGTTDPYVAIDEAQAWESYSSRGFRLVPVEGGHFYLGTQGGRLLEEIDRDLQRVGESS